MIKQKRKKLTAGVFVWSWLTVINDHENRQRLAAGVFQPHADCYWFCAGSLLFFGRWFVVGVLHFCCRFKVDLMLVLSWLCLGFVFSFYIGLWFSFRFVST